MNPRSRRAFLADVGKGMLVAGVGPALATDLGLAPAFADEKAPPLSFGEMEPLVALLQETPPDKLLPLLVQKLRSGTHLRTLIAGGALANARTFGGGDYNGYHAFMALVPSYHMAQETPEAMRPLPILKVLYRNSSFIQAGGCRTREALHPIEPAHVPTGEKGGDFLRAATHRADKPGAERALAALTQGSVEQAFADLQLIIEDEVDVHRVVLAWRSWAALDFTGRDQALTLLRQSVRFCVDSEKYRIDHKRPASEVRTVLPKLLDQYGLLGKKAGTRRADDAVVEKLCQTIYASNRAQAADAVAAALGEGFALADVTEAICLAANRLVLRDPGRTRAQVQPGKPVGSVHGASVGVHASDAANAWRNIAHVSSHRNAVASLIVAAYHTAGQAGQAARPPLPWAEHLAAVKSTDPKALLSEAAEAIKAREQERACAVVQRYAELGHPERPVFDLLLKFGTSQDGALHAEKYYRTVTEEFAATRPAFRWRQLVGLARVSASEYGFPAPGYDEAVRLLKT